MEAKVLLFELARLSCSIKLPVQETLVVCNDLCPPSLAVGGKHPNFEIASPAEEGCPDYWRLSKAHILVASWVRCCTIWWEKKICRKQSEIHKYFVGQCRGFQSYSLMLHEVTAGLWSVKFKCYFQDNWKWVSLPDVLHYEHKVCRLLQGTKMLLFVPQI